MSALDAFLEEIKRDMSERVAAMLVETLPAPERLLTTEQVAEMLNVTDRTVRKLALDGKIPSLTVGDKAVRFELGRVQGYIASQRRVASGSTVEEDRGPEA